MGLQASTQSFPFKFSLKYFSLTTVLYFEIYWTLSILQIGEEKSTVIGLMRKAISQQFTDEVSKRRQFLASFLHVHCIMYLYLRDTECCRASVASKQQHNQDIP